MQTIILRTLAVVGLTVGLSTIAAASPATPLISRDTAVQNSQIQQVYYYNHHRYNHRAWDKRRRRWRYY